MDVIFRILTAVASRARALFYRARGVRIHGKCWLRAIEIPRYHGAICLENGVALDRGVVLLVSGGVTAEPKIILREGVYVNRQTIFDASQRIEIGARAMIGPFCYVTDHDHTFLAGGAPSEGPLQALPTRIEERCWLGAHVTVLKGVTIGAGSVIGAGSIVTKSIPAGVVAVGNPARVLRKIA
jgi:acetyltransferase-like isoleucine patch superfamily enzyme